VRSSLVAFLAAVTLPLTACGANSPAGWEGPSPPDEAGRLEVDVFDDYLAGLDDAARTPVAAAARFLRLDRATASVTSVVARTTAEGSGPTIVTVTLDRLADDSVRSQRYRLTFVPEGQSWTLASARFAQRCWPGRGHQSYSPAPCV
jgi:hypothetical protein